MTNRDKILKERIFERAISLSGPAREEFVEKVCREDRELGEEIKILIESHETGFLEESPSERIADEVVEDERSESPTVKHPILSRGLMIGRYRIIDLIGKGGMGDVYLADDPELDRKVAIKFLSIEFADNEERLNRFVHEAKAASSLNHPNIITVHEIGTTNGNKFIVTEYVEGKTLAELIENGDVNEHKAVDFGIQIVSALAAAHSAGIIHRDLKPENIMLRPDGLVKVLDFGLAKSTGITGKSRIDSEAKTRGKFTIPGTVMGTPQYMSPEQAKSKKVDHRTDIFSFGVLFFELLTGHLPFQGENENVTIAAIIHKEPVKLVKYVEDAPAALIAIVEKTLQKKKEDRYQDMREILVDLESVARNFQTESDNVLKTGSGVTRVTSRNQVQSWLLGHFSYVLLFLLLIGAFALSYSVWTRYGKAGVEKAGNQNAVMNVEITSWPSAAGELLGTATFSPDNKYIAFGSTKTGTQSIWVVQAKSSETIQVTKDGFYNKYPTWSPDGQEIAYYSKRGDKHGIWRVSILGGQLKQVAEINDAEAKPVRWSENGKIYYQGAFNLFALDSESGVRTQVTDLPTDNQAPTVIEMAPDEARIALIVREEGRWKIKTKRIRSGNIVQIFESERKISELDWHPDGKRILFSKLDDGTNKIYEILWDGGEANLVGDSRKDAHIQDISNDGSHVLITSATESSDIWRFDIEKRSESIITKEIESELWPEVAPDGNSIAYQSVKNLSQGTNLLDDSVFTKSLGGDGSTTLLTSNGFLPKWSNDGQMVAFMRRASNGYEIWIVRATGGNPIRATGNGVQLFTYSMTPYNRAEAVHFDWSPDSRSLAYPATREELSNIWISGPGGGIGSNISKNTDKNLRLLNPIWDSKGVKIAYSSFMKKRDKNGKRLYQLWLTDTESGSSRKLFELDRQIRLLGISKADKALIFAIWVQPQDFSQTPKAVEIHEISIETGETRLLSSLDTAYRSNIHLSPDKERLAFTARSSGQDQLWISELKGGATTMLTNNNDPRLYFSTLTWAPDNKSIFFGKQSRFSLLSMLVISNQDGENL